MNIITIPSRNLRRKPMRALLMIAVFSIGIASVVALSYLSEAVGESLEKKLTAFGANILISPKTETLAVGYGGMNLGDVSFEVKYLNEKEVIEAVQGIALKDRISAVAPKFAMLTRIGGVPAGVIGVDFPQEMSIKSYWAVNGKIPDSPEQVLAGASAAGKLGLKTGSPVEIEGKRFTVSGILSPTGGEDDNVIFADLHALQHAAGKENLVHFVEVAALCSGCPIDEITAQIGAALPNVDIKAMQQVVKQRMASIAFVKTLALSVSLVILLTACVMIALSIYSSVNERKNEIGALRAIGFSRTSIFALFSLEAFFMGLFAGVIGYAAGFSACNKILAALDLGAGEAVAFHPAHFALTFAAVAFLSVAASAPPAMKAARTEPSQALVML